MSAPLLPPRPFYTEYAWAFDLLIDRPVRSEGRTIAAWLAERGVSSGATLLDAGCGTGRYAIESWCPERLPRRIRPCLRLCRLQSRAPSRRSARARCPRMDGHVGAQSPGTDLQQDGGDGARDAHVYERHRAQC